MQRFVFASALLVAAVIANADNVTNNPSANLLNWRKDTYEPVTPVLDAAPEANGFFGRATGLDHVYADTATGDISKKTWRATAWRNERVHGQFVVWTKEAAPQLRVNVGTLKGENGTAIPPSAIKARFVRYVLAAGKPVGDILDCNERVDLPENGYRPIWLTVEVPAKQAPGIYKGTLEAIAQGGRKIKFPLELEVIGKTLPQPRDWPFFLDLWQHPWAVARYHGVKPFSAEHYALLRPIYRELANAGQKTLTVTITDLAWNHQNFDPYWSMVGHTKNADGTWTRDWSLFDEYVAFGRECGLGPQIHCYTMATWGNIVYWQDATTDDRVSAKLVPGTKEHEAFWGPFLSDFQKHLVEKGWVEDTFIAMDERSTVETEATKHCIKTYAPLLHIAMPGWLKADELRGAGVDNYCQALKSVTQDFIEVARERTAAGKTTTFYVCCSPKRPNTFTASPTAEQVWLPLFAESRKLDGFLRWAFVNWPRDPLFDTSFGHWAPGDTFLLYPGPSSSVRWEMLRDGIEEVVKIRTLRTAGADLADTDAALAKFDFAKDKDVADEEIRAKVQAVRSAIEAASRK